MSARLVAISLLPSTREAGGARFYVQERPRRPSLRNARSPLQRQLLPVPARGFRQMAIKSSEIPIIPRKG